MCSREQGVVTCRHRSTIIYPVVMLSGINNQLLKSATFADFCGDSNSGQ